MDEPKKKAQPTRKSKKAAASDEMDPEAQAMLNRIIEMKKDLDSKLKQVYDKGELYRIDVERFLNNPSFFSKSEWERIQKEKDSFTNQILAVLKPETAIRKVAKSKDAMTKDRKTKTLGSRKKNWIPMR